MKKTWYGLLAVMVSGSALLVADEGQEEKRERRVIRIDRQGDGPPDVKFYRPSIRRETIVGTRRPGNASSTWLGVHIDGVSGPLAAQLGLKPGTGLVVEHVVPDSPAAKAGIKQYDVLTKLDDQRLINPDQLQVLVGAFDPGETVEIKLIRGGKKREVEAKLAKRKHQAVKIRKLRSDNGDAIEEVIEGDLPLSEKLLDSLKIGDAIDELVWEGKVRDDLQGIHSQRVEVGNAIVVLKDDSGTYRLSHTGDKKHLKFVDENGKVVFDGDFDEKAEGVPERVIRRLKTIRAPEEVGVGTLRRVFRNLGDGKEVDLEFKVEEIIEESGEPASDDDASL